MKLIADGCINKHIGKFVVKGHHQNCDFIGTTNEVENLALDVKSTYLNSFVEIFVAQLEGFVVQESEGKAYKLQLGSFHLRTLLVV